jgi:hypothetical protein
MCACVCYTLTPTLSISYLYVRTGRGFVCVHQCAMGDGSAVCARVGGLVLRARPKTRSPKPCEPLPVGRGPRAASVRRRSSRRRRSTRTSARGTPRRSPRWKWYAPLAARRRALWRTRSAGASMRCGRLCVAAPPMRARVRTRAGTRLRGALGVGTAGRRGGSIHASEYIYISVCVCVL